MEERLPAPRAMPPTAGSGVVARVKSMLRAEPLADVQSLERLKLTPYLLGMGLVVLSLGVGTLLDRFSGPQDAFDRLLLPIVIGVLMALSALLPARRIRLFEAAAYGIGTAALFAKLVFVYYVPSPGVDPLKELSQFTHWTAVLYVVGFLMMDARRAVRANLLLLVGVIGLTAGHIATRALAGRIDELHGLLHLAASHAVMLILLFAFARIKEEYLKLRAGAVAAEHARRAAEGASRHKTEFLSRVSHELRTPMHAVLGFAQLLAMDPLTAEQREHVDHILRGGQHLLRLIDDVLEIGRIEEGQIDVKVEPVALNAVLQDALDLVRPVAVAQRVELRYEPGRPAHRHVMADRRRLVQVVLNLLTNGIKYNRPGGHVSLTWEEIAGDRLRVLVSDTGPGLSPELQARLFTPFDRLGAEKTEISGTGLGLALSRRLVEAMGGALGVESAVGRGSTFWVELTGAGNPFTLVDGMEDEVPEEELDSRLVPRLVLYIGANRSELRLIERLLAHRPGVRIIGAAQGWMGLEVAREHRPHLILLDPPVPDMPLETLLTRLRVDPGIATIPILVLSGDGNHVQVERLVALGAADCLGKPLDVKHFLTVLRERLTTRPAAAKREEESHGDAIGPGTVHR